MKQTVKKIVLAGVLATVAWSTSTLADKADPALKPLVDYFRQFTYVVTSPVYLYHWTRSLDSVSANHPYVDPATLPPIVHTNDPKGFQYVQSRAALHWSVQADQNQRDMMGTGLYAAVDPVATQGFGGGGSYWNLIQLHVPTGFRMLSLVRDGDGLLPLEVLETLDKIGCPSDRFSTLQSLIGVKPGADKKCLDAIQKIFKEQLQIDGFSYSYQAINFSECAPPPVTQQLNGGYAPYNVSSQSQRMRNSAFVLTRKEAFTPNDIKIFTAKTQDSLEDRVRIQTLFYKSKDANFGGYSNYCGNFTSAKLLSFQTAILAANPGYTQANFSGATGVYPNCTYLFQINGGTNPFKQVTYVEPTPAPTPSTSVPLLSASTAPNGQLLWPDLEGQPQDSGASDWMKKNLYGCSTKLPFRSLQSVYDEQLTTCVNCHKEKTSPNATALHQDVKKVIEKVKHKSP